MAPSSLQKKGNSLRNHHFKFKINSFHSNPKNVRSPLNSSADAHCTDGSRLLDRTKPIEFPSIAYIIYFLDFKTKNEFFSEALNQKNSSAGDLEPKNLTNESNGIWLGGGEFGCVLEEKKVPNRQT